MAQKTSFAVTAAILMCVEVALMGIIWEGLEHMSTLCICIHGILAVISTVMLFLAVDIFLLTPPDVSYPLVDHLAIYSTKRLAHPYFIWRFRKFNHQTKKCKQVQEAYLLELLHTNSGTVYGELYRFSEIKSREQFVKTVPLVKQVDVAPYCLRIASGERNVLTKEYPVMMALTTGTTGANCPFPIIKSSVMRDFVVWYAAANHVASQSLPGMNEIRKIVFYYPTLPQGKTERGIPCGVIDGYHNRIVKKMMSKISTTPEILFSLRSKNDSNHLTLLFALADKSVTVFRSSFTVTAYNAMTLIELEWRQMVQEIRTGHLHSGLKSDAETLAHLENRLKPDLARANELEAEFQKGFDGIMKRIWPYMQYIRAANSGTMALYGELLTKKYAKGLPIYSGEYGCTEGYGGVNISMLSKIPEYVLLPNTSFYEFIEEYDMEKDQPRTLFSDQVEVGKNYELVLTNLNGLCRYRPGDVVGVTGFFNNTPVMRLLYRKGQMLNLISEKTTEASVLETVKRTVAGWKNCSLHDFTCAVNAMLESVTGGLSGPRSYYVFFLELRFQDGRERQINDAEKSAMDTNLCAISELYYRHRQDNRINPIVVYVVEQGAFAALKEFILQTTNASYSQFKMPHVLKRESLVEFMLSKIKS